MSYNPRNRGSLSRLFLAGRCVFRAPGLASSVVALLITSNNFLPGASDFASCLESLRRTRDQYVGREVELTINKTIRATRPVNSPDGIKVVSQEGEVEQETRILSNSSGSRWLVEVATKFDRKSSRSARRVTGSRETIMYVDTQRIGLTASRSQSGDDPMGNPGLVGHIDKLHANELVFRSLGMLLFGRMNVRKQGAQDLYRLVSEHGSLIRPGEAAGNSKDEIAKHWVGVRCELGNGGPRVTCWFDSVEDMQLVKIRLVDEFYNASIGRDVTVVGGIAKCKYELDNDGHRRLIGYDWFSRTEYGEGFFDNRRAVIRVESAKPCYSRLDKIEPTLFNIKNGARVSIESEPHIRYEYWNGDIYKVLDDGTLASIEGIRYEPMRWSRWATYIGVALGAVFLGLVAWRSYRSRKRSS